MSAAAVFLPVVVLLVVVVLAVAVTVVPPRQAAVVERLGQHVRTLEPGVTLVLPGVDRVRRVDLGPRTSQATGELTTGEPTTGDARSVATVTLTWRVVDPVRATYEVADVEQALLAVALTAVRASGAEDPAPQVQDAVRAAAQPWGVEVSGATVHVATPRPGGQ